MLEHLGESFKKQRLQLLSGGFFEFDAVSVNQRVVASISTSSGKTSGGKNPAGKIHKLRADMLFLTLVVAERRIILLTQSDMYAFCVKEAEGGRVPKSIEFMLAELPPELIGRLESARELASVEVRTQKVNPS